MSSKKILSQDQLEKIFSFYDLLSAKNSKDINFSPYQWDALADEIIEGYSPNLKASEKALLRMQMPVHMEVREGTDTHHLVFNPTSHPSVYGNKLEVWGNIAIYSFSDSGKINQFADFQGAHNISLTSFDVNEFKRSAMDLLQKKLSQNTPVNYHTIGTSDTEYLHLTTRDGPGTHHDFDEVLQELNRFENEKHRLLISNGPHLVDHYSSNMSSPYVRGKEFHFSAYNKWLFNSILNKHKTPEQQAEMYKTEYDVLNFIESAPTLMAKEYRANFVSEFIDCVKEANPKAGTFTSWLSKKVFRVLSSPESLIQGRVCVAPEMENYIDSGSCVVGSRKFRKILKSIHSLPALTEDQFLLTLRLMAIHPIPASVALGVNQLPVNLNSIPGIDKLFDSYNHDNFNAIRDGAVADLAHAHYEYNLGYKNKDDIRKLNAQHQWLFAEDYEFPPINWKYYRDYELFDDVYYDLKSLIVEQVIDAIADSPFKECFIENDVVRSVGGRLDISPKKVNQIIYLLKNNGYEEAKSWTQEVIEKHKQLLNKLRDGYESKAKFKRLMSHDEAVIYRFVDSDKIKAAKNNYLHQDSERLGEEFDQFINLYEQAPKVLLEAINNTDGMAVISANDVYWLYKREYTNLIPGAISGASVIEKGGISNYYHNKVVSMVANKRSRLLSSVDEVKWNAVCEKQISAKGYTLTPLNSEKALIIEGQVMEHCASSYVPACKMGETFLFSMKNQDEQRIATAEISLSACNKKDGEFVLNVNLKQFYGKGNSDVIDEHALMFIEDVLCGLEKGDIPVCIDTGVVEDKFDFDNRYLHYFYSTDTASDREQAKEFIRKLAPKSLDMKDILKVFSLDQILDESLTSKIGVKGSHRLKNLKTIEKINPDNIISLERI
ncbi:PcfJ domain-containing protein [Photobacterium leiognathi]|uniref:PcfJ domain-containing protein n=1 Tax=Photobacterium leiognathi TaxID=553611 RepID=UPI0029810B3A|nr:PcfJ domain-containing protein [Photobacterium leiognathi]